MPLNQITPESLALARLEERHAHISRTLERIEGILAHTQARLVELEKFRYVAMGAWMFVAVVLPVVIKRIFPNL